MKHITLEEKTTGLKARILPDFGAMVSELNLGDIQLLKMDYENLGLGNVLSGGIPVLFPFAGKSTDNIYSYAGKEYPMPMHGFAKDLPFNVIDLQKRECTLQLSAAEIINNWYPFNFDLKISYQIDEYDFIIKIKVINLSEKKMPLNLGFHPYFVTSNKENVIFEFNLKKYFNFYDSNGEQGVLNEQIDLSRTLDHVFYGDKLQEMRLFNKEDGYKLSIVTDDTFNVVTVYTGKAGVSCIEPWQNVPNNIIDKDQIKYIPAQESEEFWIKISVDSY